MYHIEQFYINSNNEVIGDMAFEASDKEYTYTENLEELKNGVYAQMREYAQYEESSEEILVNEIVNEKGTVILCVACTPLSLEKACARYEGIHECVWC